MIKYRLGNDLIEKKVLCINLFFVILLKYYNNNNY